MMTIMIRVFEMGSAAAQSAVIMGISVMARKWPKIEDPAISIRAMIEVFNDPRNELTSILELISRRDKARRKTAIVPMVPASVGLKNPTDHPADNDAENH